MRLHYSKTDFINYRGNLRLLAEETKIWTTHLIRKTKETSLKQENYIKHWNEVQFMNDKESKNRFDFEYGRQQDLNRQFIFLSLVFLSGFCFILKIFYDEQGGISAGIVILSLLFFFLFGSFIFFVIFYLPIKKKVQILHNGIKIIVESRIGTKEYLIPFFDLVYLRLRWDHLFGEDLRLVIMTVEKRRERCFFTIASEWGQSSFIRLCETLNERILEGAIQRKCLKPNEEFNLFYPIKSTQKLREELEKRIWDV